MGDSTNGILFYGFALSGEKSEEIGIYDEDEVPNELQRLAWKEEPDGLVQLDIHGSCEYPEYFAYTRKFEAYRGYPELIEVPSIGEDEIADLRRFAKKYDLGRPNLGWYLCSLWC